jgi:hypothetical protein
MMSVPGIASAVLFAGIGLMALALGLSARRHFQQAFAVGLLGLLVLAGTSTWITLAASTIPYREQGVKTGESDTPAPPSPPSGNRIDELTRQLRDAMAVKGNAEHERDAAQAVAETASQQLVNAVAERDTASTAASDARRRLEAEQARNTRLQSQVAELEKGLAQQPPAPTPPPTSSTVEVRRLLSSANYVLQPLSQSEIVRNLHGRWYAVKLGPKIEFGDRQFALADRDGRIRDAAEQLKRDVLDPLAKLQMGLRLFVRGSADDRPVSVRTESSGITEYRSLPGSIARGYQPIEQDQIVRQFITNDDLPNLRALSLSKVVSPALGVDVVMLHNVPGTGEGRSAELILFVPP